NDGNLDTLKEGTAKIKISTKNQNKEIKVIVTNNEIDLENMIFIEEKVNLNVNEKYLLEIKTYPENALTSDLQWTSENENIVKITDGYLEILNPGTSQITVSKKIGDKEISARIKVNSGNKNAVEVKSLDFEEEIITLGLNESYQLSPIIKPDNASKQIEYKILDESIIDIDELGVIKTKKKGITSVIALANNEKSKIIEVKVETKEDGLTINKKEISIAKEENYQLKSNYVSNIEWYSSNNKIAIVDQKGYVRGINNGEAIITVINNYGRMDTVKVNVKGNGVPVSKILVNKDQITIQTGKSYKLKAEIIPKNATNKEITWETMDNRIAQVTDDGMIVGKIEGNTVITGYSSNNKQVVIRVFVTKGSVSIDELEINPSSLTIIKGDTYQLRATLIPSNVSDKKVIWNSSNTNIVSITESGLIKANKTGSVVISATSNGVTGKAVINVRTSITEISNIDIKENDIEIDAGKTKNLTVAYLPSNASNKNFSWISSNETIATISNKGVITGKKEGTVTITVSSSNGKKDSINVNVKKAKEPEGVIAKVYINVENVSLQKGQTKKLRATILPLNAKQEVTWISDNANVVSVDSNGTITAINPGKTIVAAIATNGMIARTKVKVQFPPINPSGNAKIIGKMYSDTLRVTFEKPMDYHVTRIWLAEPGQQIHKTGGIGLRTVPDQINSAIVENNLGDKIVVATNGSGFHSSRFDSDKRYNNSSMGKLIITDGEVLRNEPNYEERVSTPYYYYLFDEDGTLNVAIGNKESTLNKIINDNTVNTFAFYPVFMYNYEPWAIWNTGTARRQGLCQIDANNYAIVTTGMNGTLPLINNVFKYLGCKTGVNLDGGGSTALIFKNRGQQSPGTIIVGGRREVGDALYFTEL
ncbi:MAG: Ig-like domain-containing protein, partial [Bacilli bacterium]